MEVVKFNSKKVNSSDRGTTAKDILLMYESIEDFQSTLDKYKKCDLYREERYKEMLWNFIRYLNLKINPNYDPGKLYNINERNIEDYENLIRELKGYLDNKS